MKQISFTRGAALRRIFINGRTFTYLGAELNNVPLKINLDKLNEHKDKIKKMNLDIKLLKEIAKLQTEDEIASDFIQDFQKSGWRRIRK